MSLLVDVGDHLNVQRHADLISHLVHLCRSNENVRPFHSTPSRKLNVLTDSEETTDLQGDRPSALGQLYLFSAVVGAEGR